MTMPSTLLMIMVEWPSHMHVVRHDPTPQIFNEIFVVPPPTHMWILKTGNREVRFMYSESFELIRGPVKESGEFYFNATASKG